MIFYQLNIFSQHLFNCLLFKAKINIEIYSIVMKNKLKQIIDFEEGQKIKGFFLCIEKHFRFTKKNDKYIDMN